MRQHYSWARSSTIVIISLSWCYQPKWGYIICPFPNHARTIAYILEDTCPVLVFLESQQVWIKLFSNDARRVYIGTAQAPIKLLLTPMCSSSTGEFLKGRELMLFHYHWHRTSSWQVTSFTSWRSSQARARLRFFPSRDVISRSEATLFVLFPIMSRMTAYIPEDTCPALVFLESQQVWIKLFSNDDRRVYWNSSSSYQVTSHADVFKLGGCIS